jgi:hypothetical protein
VSKTDGLLLRRVGTDHRDGEINLNEAFAGGGNHLSHLGDTPLGAV